MIRAGSLATLFGIVLLALPFGWFSDLAGLIIIGLGCAPIYPGIMHATPFLFGAEKTKTLIGVQLASAYGGYLLLPPLFGLIANHIHPVLFPLYIAIVLAVMLVMFEKTCKKCRP